MLLKSIKLENIRSYLNEKIEFPEGRVMLSGDIGSGKSTILLAAEFALFGVMKGDVPGESLLRNGKKEGSVELHLEISGKDIIISRQLKRGSAGVKQDSGYIIIDGLKKAATATELKALILEIMGYPKDLLTKSKGLIYRYTVYTPQEEMKKILFDDDEARLNTLRKVFDADKYKRIRENAKSYSLELKGNIRQIEGSILDLEEKKKHADEISMEIRNVEKGITEIKPLLEAAKADAEACRRKEKECRQDVEMLSKLKQELAGLDADLRNKLAQRQRNSIEIERASKQAETLKKEIRETGEADASELIIQNEMYLRGFEQKKIDASKRIAEIESRKRHSEDIKEKISRMEDCPLCMQKVAYEHKKAIKCREDENIAKIANYLQAYFAQEKEADECLKKTRMELDLLRKRQIAFEAAKAKIASMKHAEMSVQRLNAEQEEAKKEIGEINARKIEASAEIEKLKGADERYGQAASDAREKDKKYMEINLKHNTLETKKREKELFAEKVHAEIAKKEKDKSRLAKIRTCQQWIDTNFSPIMELMEKQVMAKVHHSFNGLFQTWFETLMEDETITARLDDKFTPVIQQNGYETSMAYLSGGEKTSCALSYRLALNKVINDLISTVQTKDLIILDEPTDGFSTEQLDRVREVIEQLGMRQVIIVSHEQKMEGFVDNVIRIQKKEHVSSVA